MPVAVQMPSKRQEKDPLDTIMKGLSLAGSVFGIKEANAKGELLAQQMEQQKTDRQFAQAAKEAELSGQGFEKQVSEDGAISFLRPPGYQSIDDKYKDAQTGKLLAETAALKNGKNGSDGGLKGLLAQYELELKAGKLREQNQKANEISGSQGQAATFGRRLEQANNVINELAESGYDRSSMSSAIGANLPDAVKPNMAKRQDQAERNFINAILRRESGAAISPTEFESAEKQYFTRVGDSPELIAQKEQNRIQALTGLQAEAGRAWEKVPLVAMPEAKSKARGSFGLDSAEANTGKSVQEKARQLEKLSDEDLDRLYQQAVRKK